MKFRVHGANPKTGDEFDFDVDAATIQEAEAKAQAAGMLVNRVVPITDQHTGPRLRQRPVGGGWTMTRRNRHWCVILGAFTVLWLLVVGIGLYIESDLWVLDTTMPVFWLLSVGYVVWAIDAAIKSNDTMRTWRQGVGSVFLVWMLGFIALLMLDHSGLWISAIAAVWYSAVFPLGLRCLLWAGYGLVSVVGGPDKGGGASDG